MNRVQVALTGAAVAPALGLAVNTIWPPANYAYAHEQFLLVVLALGALAVSRATATGAIFLYCATALLPVGAMLEYWAGIGGGFSVLALIPHAGVLVVSSTTRNYLATLVYGVVAALASGIYGGISGDLGQAGALVFLAGLASFWASRWVECSDVRLHSEVENIRRETDELGAMVQSINQQWETINHDT